MHLLWLLFFFFKCILQLKSPKRLKVETRDVAEKHLEKLQPENVCLKGRIEVEIVVYGFIVSLNVDIELSYKYKYSFLESSEILFSCCSFLGF